MLKRVLEFLLIPVALLAAFGATSYAADAAPVASDGSLLDLARPVLDAVIHGQYWLGGSLALVLAVAVLRQYGGAYLPWLKTGQGAALMALLATFGATLAAAFAGGAMPSGHLVWTAAKIAVASAGIYSLLKALVVDPYVVPLAAKYPKYRLIFVAILWLFDRLKEAPAPARETVQDKRTGDAAGTAYASAPPPAERHEGAGSAPTGTSRDHRTGK